MERATSTPKRRTIAEKVRKRILALPGVEERPLHLSHAIVPRAYWVGETEFVHFHGQWQLDLRVPDATMRSEFLRDPRAKVNPFARSRIEFDFASSSDAEDAFHLVERVHHLLRQEQPFRLRDA